MGMYEQIQSNKTRTLVLFSLFFVFILFLGFVFGELLGIGLWGLVIALAIALLMTFFSYYYSDSIVIKMYIYTLLQTNLTHYQLHLAFV